MLMRGSDRKRTKGTKVKVVPLSKLKGGKVRERER